MALPQLVDDMELFEFVDRHEQIDPGVDARVLIYTIHDGAQLPRHLFGELDQGPLADPEVRRAYRSERDWGANLVAGCLAEELGLSGYARVNLARLALDFGRFPGSSSHGVPYLFRKSIYPPLESMLAEETKHELITHYYDGISNELTRLFSSRLLMIGIHTYDPKNHSGTYRPEVSLVTRSLEYQADSTIPEYLYDPLFPAALCEATCDRSMSYRTALEVEQSGRHVAMNYPYLMPAGCVEVRAQVWFFFRYLRQEFTAAHPDTASHPAYQRVWQMLLDVTRRSADAQALRGYLHRYREASHDHRSVFALARRAYDAIHSFRHREEERLLAGYRLGERRPSCLGVEVRKDLLCNFDGLESITPHPQAEAAARDITRRLGRGIRAYLATLGPVADLEVTPSNAWSDGASGLGAPQ